MLAVLSSATFFTPKLLLVLSTLPISVPVAEPQIWSDSSSLLQIPRAAPGHLDASMWHERVAGFRMLPTL